jgi:hypothetical protein
MCTWKIIYYFLWQKKCRQIKKGTTVFTVAVILKKNPASADIPIQAVWFGEITHETGITIMKFLYQKKGRKRYIVPNLTS